MIICFIGTTELILIGGLALLMFGGKKLPEMMRGLGKGVKEFKDGLHESNSMKNPEKETTAPNEARKGEPTQKHDNLVDE